jgi:3-oxoacyl-[acyl-carrier protein] reductase
MKVHMELEHKVAVVTGGASGFGAGIAKRFAEEGAQVIIADIDDARGAELARDLGAVFARCDVTREADFQALLHLPIAASGIDILVNNAGMGHTPQPLDTLSADLFERLYHVNMRSIFLSAQVLVPHMKARRSGAIVNVASTAGVSPRPNLCWYNASKGWVITATRAMAVELAPFGIRVNAVNPVAGETPMLQTFMGGDTPEVRAKFLSTIPLGRFSTPEDIANAVCYLASDRAAMVTGVAMEVDGGRCI